MPFGARLRAQPGRTRAGTLPIVQADQVAGIDRGMPKWENFATGSDHACGAYVAAIHGCRGAGDQQQFGAGGQQLLQ